MPLNLRLNSAIEPKLQYMPCAPTFAQAPYIIKYLAELTTVIGSIKYKIKYNKFKVSKIN